MIVSGVDILLNGGETMDAFISNTTEYNTKIYKRGYLAGGERKERVQGSDMTNIAHKRPPRVSSCACRYVHVANEWI